MIQKLVYLCIIFLRVYCTYSFMRHGFFSCHSRVGVFVCRYQWSPHVIPCCECDGDVEYLSLYWSCANRYIPEHPHGYRIGQCCVTLNEITRKEKGEDHKDKMNAALAMPCVGFFSMGVCVRVCNLYARRYVM